MLAKIGSKLPIFPKIYFLGKIACYYCLSTVLYHTTCKKKILEWKPSDKIAYFGPNWVRVSLSTKSDFLGKVDQHCFGLLCTIMLHNFKKIH